MDIKEIVAINLKYLIADSKVNQIAAEIGINQQTLQRYLHAEREMKPSIAIKIADYFDVSLDFIYGRKSYTD